VSELTQAVLHQNDFRLSYGECDPAGIVYFAAYYPWFERVYNEWTFLGGFPATGMPEAWGASHVSVASQCEYHLPGRLHDPFTARMRLGHLGTTSFAMRFSIDHRENGRAYAEGSITFVFVDRATPPRPTPVPREFHRILVDAGALSA